MGTNEPSNLLTGHECMDGREGSVVAAAVRHDHLSVRRVQVGHVP